ncbi:hypothetical protein [Legionella sp. PC1000]|nr:hypothetical protein [Legionella sp. PC1000]
MIKKQQFIRGTKAGDMIKKQTVYSRDEGGGMIKKQQFIRGTKAEV